MERQSFKDALIGAFEIFIMMPNVTERFSAQKKDALKSFIYPVLQYPLILWAFAQTNHTSDPVVFLLHAFTSWAGVFLFYGLIYALAHQMKRIEYFWQFVNMSNTYAILATILLLPIFGSIYAGHTGGTFFQQYWVFFILVELAFTAFIVTKSLRLNWLLGGFFATVSLFLSDLGSRFILFYVHQAHEVAMNSLSVISG